MANWDKIQSEGEVEDRRSVAGTAGIGFVGTIVIAGIVLLAGGDASQVRTVLSQLQTTQNNRTQGEFVDTKNYLGFAKKVIGSNNDVWSKEFQKLGKTYQEPTLVLFRSSTQSGCGGANSQIGPHYCQRDKTIYLDETFFEELTKRFGAKGGEVAEAYVMAHEVGHHIQNINGTFGRINTSDNKSSVKVELQADCFAGVWAGNVKELGIITEAEVGQAIDAAEAVGDDRIQKTQTGTTNPETWTHGSSKDRKQSFLTGYNSKYSKSCNSVK